MLACTYNYDRGLGVCMSVRWHILVGQVAILGVICSVTFALLASDRGKGASYSPTFRELTFSDSRKVQGGSTTPPASLTKNWVPSRGK